MTNTHAAMVKALEAEIMRQYQANKQWDDAKDVIEGLDYSAITTALEAKEDEVITVIAKASDAESVDTSRITVNADNCKISLCTVPTEEMLIAGVEAYNGEPVERSTKAIVVHECKQMEKAYFAMLATTPKQPARMIPPLKWADDMFEIIMGGTYDQRIDFVERIQANAIASVSDDWLPIETAPKDGTVILGYCKPSQLGKIMFNKQGEWECLDPLSDTPLGIGFYPTHWKHITPPREK